MGHFHCYNISRHVVRHIYAKGSASLRQLTDAAIRQREAIHASEGIYTDRDMIEDGVLTLMLIHIDRGTLTVAPIEPDLRDLWFRFRMGDFDWEDARFEQIRDIPVRFAPGGRRKYIEGTIPHVSEIDR